MKVKEVMMGTPYFCTPDANLGVAAEMMWNANCGFLPIQSSEGQVIGVVTDRDICIALCTRNRLPGDISVQEVMTSTLYSCSPEEDIHVALQTMREGKVRRLPVVAENGALVGVISMDDVLLRTEPIGLGKEPELSSDEVVRTFRAITARPVPQLAKQKVAAA